MSHLWAFFLGFVFSFVGSIPPGTLNITVLQLSLERQVKTAIRFALAVAIVEYPYAWIGVQFEFFLSTSPLILENFQLIAALVMTLLGISNLLPRKTPTGLAKKFSESGFRRGIILSLLNPMTIVYWMGFTAYMNVQGWLYLGTPSILHIYVFGTAVGTLAFLFGLIFLARRLSPDIQGSRLIRIIPGLLLLGLGLYAWWKYFF